MFMPFQIACHPYTINKTTSAINWYGNEEFLYLKGEFYSAILTTMATGSRPIRYQELTSITYVCV